jgi:hypothetical protein
MITLRLSSYFKHTAPAVQRLITVSVNGAPQYYPFSVSEHIDFEDELVAKAALTNIVRVPYSKAMKEILTASGESVSIEKKPACCGGVDKFIMEFKELVEVK